MCVCVGKSGRLQVFRNIFLCVSYKAFPLNGNPAFSIFRYYCCTVIIAQVQSACSAVFQAKSATCRILYKPNTLAWNYPSFWRLSYSHFLLSVCHTHSHTYVLSVLKANVTFSFFLFVKSIFISCLKIYFKENLRETKLKCCSMFV